MPVVVFSPSWFFGIDAALESVTVLVAFLLSILAFRIYKLLKESSFFHFALAFFMISVGYLVKILSDLYVYKNIGSSMVANINIILYTLSPLEFVNIFGNLAFRFLVLLGFLILLIVFLKIKDRRIVFLFMYFIFIISAFSAWSFLLFQTTLTVLAGTVCVYYLFHYMGNRKSIIMMSLIGFSFIFIAQVSFMFTFFFERIMFVLGHIAQALGFIILFVTYLLVSRR